MVLWDLKLVVQFPPGSTILIPSALIKHSNTGVGRNEHRYSFTQFAAGGLFRLVHNDFRLAAEVMKDAKQDAVLRAKVEEGNMSRFSNGMDMWSKLSELSTIH